MSSDPNDVGSSRFHLIKGCEDSLRRLNTDYIDIYTMHGFDASTPVEETLRTLDTLVQSGKVHTGPHGNSAAAVGAVNLAPLLRSEFGYEPDTPEGRAAHEDLILNALMQGLVADRSGRRSSTRCRNRCDACVGVQSDDRAGDTIWRVVSSRQAPRGA